MRLQFGGEEIGSTLWDMQEGKKLGQLSGFALAACFSQDGKTVVTASPSEKGGLVQFWDSATRKKVREFTTEGQTPFVMALSDDGKDLAAGLARSNFFDDHDQSETAVVLLDAVTGKLLRVLSRHGPRTRGLAFSPDGKMLAASLGGTVEWSGAIRLFDAATGKPLPQPEGHSTTVTAIAFQKGGFATAGKDGMVREWDASGKVRQRHDLSTDCPEDIAISPDGSALAWVDVKDAIRARDLGTGKALGPVRIESLGRMRVRFRPDGAALVARGELGVRLWDFAGRKETILTEGEKAYRFDAAFSPDGKRVALCDYDRPITIHDAATGKNLLTFDRCPKSTGRLAFSANGKTLVASHEDQSLTLWGTATGKRHGRQFSHPSGNPRLHAYCPAALSPDGGLLATGDVGYHGDILIHDTAKGSTLARLKGHALPIAAL